MWQIVGIAVGLAIIVAPLVWGWLKQHPGLLADGGIRLLIILAWLRVVTPSVLQLLLTGRTPPGRRELPMPEIGTAAAQGIGLLFLAVALVLLIASINRRPARHFGWLAAALAPWAALQVSHLLAGGTPDIWAAAYPAAAVAIWLRPPAIQVLATIGALTAVSAAASLLLLVAAPDLAMYASGEGVKTMYESGLLAGIYPHANMLGMAMALGIPFVFLIQRPKVRLWCLVLSVGVLLATASRSSLAAAAVAVLLYLLMRKHPGRAQQRTALPLLAAVGVMAYLPLTTEDSTAFTDRGRIWMLALSAWRDQPWTGWGPNAFTEVNRLVNGMTQYHTHAHNLLAMTLVTGGLAMVAAMVLMLFLTWRRAVHLSRDGHAQPLIWLTVVIVVSWLEASLSLNSLTGYLLWLPLLVILLGRSSDGGPDEVGQDGAGAEAAGGNAGRHVRLPSGLLADRMPVSRRAEDVPAAVRDGRDRRHGATDE